MKRIDRTILQLLLVAFASLFLSACAIFGDPTELDDTKGWQANRIYAEGAQKMQD